MAADAAAPAPEKKIGEEISSPDLPAQPLASHTRGAAIDVPTSPHGGKPPRAKPSAAAEPAHFAAFWEAYPRHDDRQKAVAAFARLSAEDQAAAPARAAEWIARRSDWITPEGKDFRPYAATWLNNKRWRDEPLPAAPSPAAAAAGPSQVSKRQATSAALRARYQQPT